MSFRQVIHILRTVNDPHLSTEMEVKYSFSQDEIELFQQLKGWELEGLFSGGFGCKHPYLDKIASVVALEEKYRDFLPAIEIAVLQEKIWRIDKSKHQVGAKAASAYLELARRYENDDDPENYLAISLGYLYRALSFAKQTKNEKFSNEVVSFLNDLLLRDFSDELVRAKLVVLLLKVSISDRCANFDDAAAAVLEINLSYDNECFLLDDLYPLLMKIGKIDQENVVGRMLRYAEGVASKEACRAVELYRNIKKKCLEKNISVSENVDKIILDLNARCEEDIWRNGFCVEGTITQKVKKIDLSGQSTEEVVDGFLDFPYMSKSSAFESTGKNIFTSIATLSAIDSDNRKRTDSQRANLVSLLGSLYCVEGFGMRAAHIKHYLLVMGKADSASRECLSAFFKSKFPNKYSLALADALYFLTQQEFHVALPLAIPRFEAILKDALFEIGIVSSVTQTDKLDSPVGLGTLITRAYEEKLISEDERFEIECLLCDEAAAGKVVRHEVAHGSLSDDQMGDVYRLNAVWLVFKLAFKFQGSGQLKNTEEQA